MKRKKHYTFIIAENSSASLKTITVDKKYIHIFLGFLFTLFLILTAFLTDYFSLYVDQWRLSQLKKENNQLEQKFIHVNQKLSDLEKRVYKISDLSKKIQLIVNASPEGMNQQGFGKIHSSSAIMALSGSSPYSSRNLSSVEVKKSASSKKSEGIDTKNLAHRDELEVRIERLKGKSELVKQNAWTIYTNLLEMQDVLNGTPSILPTRGWISSRFGYRNETIFADHEPYFHRGVDIASAIGRPVVATADGVVTRTGYDENGYGNLIVIDHGYGLETYYGHLAEIKTKKGNKIHRGEVIAEVGNTGKSTGPHLHYEVRILGSPVNPENYILDQADFHLATNIFSF